MAGSKRAKLKKVFANASGQSHPANADDDDLVDDLMAHLDSRDTQVQAESATILNEMHLDKQGEAQGKRDPRSRFIARQVCPWQSGSRGAN